ncbi:chemotaxis protein CheD [Methanococcus voltae]|uniref:Probable chemoreceptor glutamine deamidase CheD n=1 Tax=Methanococcus voltae (strain ATCC BAA-1334 / A3) TaxID=456320 RepID=D7DTZ7_METV3|nr:chemotaxis protein CheD [Methanococcus voltae]MCS3900407.1 chemotaxis protein CheD [Methanococcus voltae]
MVLKVKMGGYEVSKGLETMETLLGSCVAIILYDRGKKIGGMAHVMLPKSNSMAHRNPGKYADTAVSILLNDMVKLGARKNKIIAKLVGGAAMFDCNSQTMDIGKRNIDSCKSELRKVGIRTFAEDVGGTNGRTVYFNLKDGEVKIRNKNDIKIL